MEKGIYCATLTPMHEDLTCDVEELAKHSLDVIQRGCKGIVLFGTTGEGASFSVKERLETLQAVIGRGVSPAKIILANGSANIADTIELVQGALNLGVSTVLIAPPCVYKNPQEEGVIQFYRTLILKLNNPKLKILLYHIPQLTGVPITFNIIEQLITEFPEVIIGLKESESNLTYLKSLTTSFPTLQVFVGSETQLIEGLSHGAQGAICGLANCFPELIASLMKAKENPNELLDIAAARKGLHFVPAFKALVEHERGTIWHTLRPPLMPLTNLERSMYLSQIHKIKLEA